MSDIVIYGDGNVELKTVVDKETIWLNQKQLCVLFGRDKSVISRHISNIFKSQELDKDSVVAKHATTAEDGKTYQVDYYNLDMVISLGYRVNSKQATKFRQWATKVLKSYLIDGYAINQKRLQQQKLQELENTINLIKQSMSQKELSADEAKGFGNEKAANLLYYIIKGHPFNDGNKRIGAYLFVLFLHKNGILSQSKRRSEDK